jgi:hypothetical protein
MAEAHSAVAFSFSITHEGWDVNFDREVLHLVWQSGVRSWKKRLARFKVKIVHAYVRKYLYLVFRSNVIIMWKAFQGILFIFLGKDIFHNIFVLTFCNFKWRITM